MLNLKSPILQQTLIFLLLAACVALTTSFPFIDVLLLNNSLGEASLTELAQAFFLFSCCSLWLRIAIKAPSLRGGCILIAGFYAALLIRELDYYFDAIRHGAWFWFALASTAASLYYAWAWRNSVANGLKAFISHPAAGYTLCGFVAVLVFSRLFGMSLLWQGLLEQHYVMVVKSAVEEGSELMGYTLCLFSSVWFCLGLKRAPQMLFESQRNPVSSAYVDNDWKWSLQQISRTR